MGQKLNLLDICHTKAFPPVHRAMSLEQRLLFDGAAVVVADSLVEQHDSVQLESLSGKNIDAVFATSELIPAFETITSYEQSVSLSKEIAIVDSSVMDISVLVNSLSETMSVYIVDGASSGLSQISSILERETGVSALHIFSHGFEGTLLVGSDSLSTHSIQNHTEQLHSIGSLLAPNADILLYGCSIASDPQFLTAFSSATGADVAASIDLTGSSSYGGNWILEQKVGDITAREVAIPQYTSLLVPAAFFGTDTAAGRTSFTTQINNANPTGTVFYSYDFTSAYNSNGLIAVTGSDNSTVYMKITRDNSSASVNNIASYGGTIYYYVNASVSISSWAEALREGVKFEFFSDSGGTNPLYINAFSAWTYDWGTCCNGSNYVPEGGMATGTALYAAFTKSDDTTSITRIGNITSSINSTTHFAAAIDDANLYKAVTLVPNGSGEYFLIGGRIYFSKVGLNSIPAGSGWTPSVPPSATINPQNGSSSIPVGSNITITFSEPVRYVTNDTPLTNANLSNILILKQNNASGNNIAYSATINDLKTVITINPTQDFGSGAQVYIAVSNNTVEDLDNNLLSATSATFTAASGGVPTGSITPADGSNNVLPTIASITISYDEAVRKTDNTELTDTNIDSLVTLRYNTSYGAPIAFDATISADKQTVTITPTSGFSTNQTIYVAIAGLEDFSDNPAANLNATFTTVSNVPPTLTTFADPVDSVLEDTEVEITFAELATKGNEADSDGTVSSFAVKSVISGTLKIGTSSASASAFHASNNYIINGTNKAYWTPNTNAFSSSATTEAFAVTAVDNVGSESNTPVTVRVNVSAVDDAPVATDLLAIVPVGSQQLFSQFSPTYSDADGHQAVAIEMLSLPTHGSFEKYINGTWQTVSGVSASNPLTIFMNELTTYRYNTINATSGQSSSVNWRVITASDSSSSATWLVSNTATGTILVQDSNSNSAPVISLSQTSATITEDNHTSTISMVISDDATPTALMPFVVLSSNPRLLDATGVSFERSQTTTAGDTFRLVFTPKADAYGTATLTLGTSDGNKSTFTQFSLTVTAVNDTPTTSSFEKSVAMNTAFCFSQINPTTIYSDSHDANANTNTGIININTATVAQAVTANLLPKYFVIESTPNHGSLTLNNTLLTAGSTVDILDLSCLVYIPDTNYAGTDSFWWHAVDEAPNGAAGIQSASTAAVFVVYAPTSTVYDCRLAAVQNAETPSYNVSKLSGYSHSIALMMQQNQVAHTRLSHIGTPDNSLEVGPSRYDGSIIHPTIHEVKMRYLEGKSDAFAGQYGLGRNQEIVRQAVLEGAQLAHAVRHVVSSNRPAFMEVPDELIQEQTAVVKDASRDDRAHSKTEQQTPRLKPVKKSSMQRSYSDDSSSLGHMGLTSNKIKTSLQPFTAKKSSAEHSFSSQLSDLQHTHLMPIFHPTSSKGSPISKYGLSSLEQALFTLTGMSGASDVRYGMTPLEEQILTVKR